MGNLFAELKRRHIYRVAAAYAVVAWIVLQIVNNVAPAFNLPGSAVMLVIVLLAAGFPIALIFAWVLELKSPNAPTTTNAMDWVLVAVAMAFVGMFAYQQFAPSRATVTAQSGIEAAREAAAKPAGISVAVLPFVNLSSDKEQEFFSDGMTEEITSALAKVPDLRVVARTSAFEFKGKSLNIKTVGEQLNATHLIEGSVRKAGDRVRITVQLIKSDDGTHLWSEDYDRQLTDIFQIQEDIARAITTSLRMPLGLKPGENLVSNRAIDPESYQQFLRVRVVASSSTVPQQLAILEPLVAKNPNYAPAWARLAQAYRLAAQGLRLGSEARSNYEAKREAAVRRSIELDPNLVEAQVELAIAQSGPRRLLLREDIVSNALLLEPNNPSALAGYSQLLLGVGRLKEALTLKQRLHEVEPLSATQNVNLAQTLWLNGDTDAAITLMKENFPNAGARLDLAQIYASLGRYGEAADLIVPFASQGSQGQREQASVAVRLLRSAPAKVAEPERLPRLVGNRYVFLYVGAPERALEPYEAGGMNMGEISLLWHASYAPVRKTERFKKIMRDEGLVAYWRERGWPELCHPTTGDDFECN